MQLQCGVWLLRWQHIEVSEEQRHIPVDLEQIYAFHGFILGVANYRPDRIDT